jgi:predicted glycosyltransferase
VGAENRASGVADGVAVVMYAQNGAGLGHFRRCANVAEAAVNADAGAHVVIVNRSIAPVATVPLPERCDALKLPAFAPLGDDASGERRVLLDREPPRFVRLRSHLVLALLEELRPRSVLVDNEPAGLQGELVEPLRQARSIGIVERVVCGLRDIRGRPQHVLAKWRRDGTARALEELYDLVLIYGDPWLVDTAGLYGLGSDIAVTTRSIGYLFRATHDRDALQVREDLDVPAAASLVAVTAGSGADGFSVLELYLREGAPRLPSDAVAVAVAGPLMPEDEYESLRALAGGRCRVVRTYDAVSLAGAADAAVCRGGYNSVCEAVHAGHTPLVVPRVTASGEQEARAEAFAARGLVEVLHPSRASGAAMADAIARQLRAPRRPASPFDPAASARKAARELMS